MVSSLPFLAPVFLRRAKEYRSKASNGYGSSGERSRRIGIKGSEVYKLGSVSRDAEFASGNSGSDENILMQKPEHSIVKSVTYTVQVEDEQKPMEKPRAFGGTRGL
jgi:hypothetical protein